MRASLRGGFSLLELLISMVVGVLVLGAAGICAKQGLLLHAESVAISDTHKVSVRALDRIVGEARGAGGSMLAPQPVPPLSTATIEFSKGSGWDAPTGVVQWDTPVRLGFEYEPGELDNGLDDDADGLIDEGQVVRTLDPLGAAPERAVLARGVAELAENELANGLDDNGNGLIDETGLCFWLAGSGLQVSITLERAAPPGSSLGTIVRTQTATISLRN